MPLAVDGSDFCLCLGDGGARFEPAFDLTNIPGGDSGDDLERDVETGADDAIKEAGNIDADDCVGLIVDEDGFPDDVWIGMISIDPEAVYEDDYMIIARSAFIGEEVATERQRRGDWTLRRTGATDVLRLGVVGIGDTERAP